MKSYLEIKEIIFLTLLGLFSFGIDFAIGGNHPNMFVNQDEINAVKTKLGQEPWKTAYSRMISKANSALSQKLLSVADNGGGYATNYDPHKFSADSPAYTPKGDNQDFLYAQTINNAVVALGMAYAFTSDSKYADKAIALIYQWCLNPATYMEPSNNSYGEHVQGAHGYWSIAIMTTIPGLFYGADLIWNYTGWDSKVKADFAEWTRKYGFSCMSQDGGYYNNGENWRISAQASAGALIDNNTLLDHAFLRWKNTFDGYLNSSHPTGQMNLDGSLSSEIVRGWSLGYGNYAMQAMGQGAEIARHRGLDFYNYKLADGRGMAKGADYMAPGTANESVWPHDNSPTYGGHHSAYFEYMNLWKSKATYGAVINKWGRPIAEDWIVRHTTLTHAAGAYSWKVHEVAVNPNELKAITMQAEDMVLNGYLVDNSSKLLGFAITVDPDLGPTGSGTATLSFNGASGQYDISFYGIPENDGRSTVKLYIGGTLVLNELLPEDKGYYSLSYREVYTINNVTVNNGDEIKIEGFSALSTPSSPDQGGSYARVDKIDFIPLATSIEFSLDRDLTLVQTNSLYPNPTRGKVFINNMMGDTFFGLYNLSGSLIKHINAQNGALDLLSDGISMKDGTYILKGSDQNMQPHMIQINRK